LTIKMQTWLILETPIFAIKFEFCKDSFTGKTKSKYG